MSARPPPPMQGGVLIRRLLLNGLTPEGDSLTSNPNSLSSVLPGSLWESRWPSGQSGLGSKSWALVTVSERVSWPLWFIVCFYLPETLTFFQKSIGFSIGVDQGRKGWLNFLSPFFLQISSDAALYKLELNFKWLSGSFLIPEISFLLT